MLSDMVAKPVLPTEKMTTPSLIDRPRALYKSRVASAAPARTAAACHHLTPSNGSMNRREWAAVIFSQSASRFM